ncbi:MAG: trigger factor [Clostridia bacterium]|nr:trigger factor [Clostridia bacterium]
MKYTLSEQEKVIKIEFTVPYDEFSVYLGKALESLCKQKNEESLSMNDFIVKYGKDELNYAALNIAMGEGYRQAVEENKLVVISQPRVNLVNLDVMADTIFTIELDKTPEFELGKYKGLEIKLSSKTPSVTVDEIEHKKAEIANQMSTLVSVEGSLQNGQTSVIDFVGSVDGVEFEGGKAENYELIIGSGMFILGFEEQMVGMEKGEVRIIKVKFPDEYTPELAGKDADFKVTLHDIKERKQPEINDELATKYAESKKLTGVNTIEDLNKVLREEIYRAKERAVFEEISQKIEDALCENNKIDIPDAIVEDEVKYQLEAYENQAKQFGMELEMMVSMMGAGSVEGLKAQIREMAKKQLSMQLILDKIIKTENITTSDEEMEAYYNNVAISRGISVDEAKKQMPKFHLEGHIISSKAMQLIKDSASIIYA